MFRKEVDLLLLIRPKNIQISLPVVYIRCILSSLQEGLEPRGLGQAPQLRVSCCTWRRDQLCRGQSDPGRAASLPSLLASLSAFVPQF